MLAVLHIRRAEFGTGDDGEVALAWMGGEISPQSMVFESSTTVGMYAPALDAFEHLLAVLESSAVLYISDSAFRREIQAASASFPGITVVDAACGRLVELVGIAVQALDDHTRFAHRRAWAAELARREALPELVVATDASKATGRSGVGVACVSAEGGFASKAYPDVDSVLAGELLAIALAIRTFPYRRLHILTDSKPALASLTKSRSRLLDTRRGDVVEIVDVVHRRAEGRDIRYSWVRGHSGHELNEIADRLAVAARRNHEAGVDPCVKEQINRNILGQLNISVLAA
ncbi:ribonuclease H family protein [Rhodococcus sp. 114MFTsu3.1]|uniref:ribonuclease H family protein n=1 Tax=Rhodococcus sp. 114MFTsu3.1 TaxID=1172184 RepID=UPI00035FE413|nr:ribonuclease H family protein [Rhodococcus sp. 114MFTsu3.1]